MPNSSSAKKSMRKAATRRERNRTDRSALRSVTKKFREVAAGTDAEATASAFQLLSKALDKAAAKNLIHANKAARTKSRLSKLVKK
ncbi:MAG: 30S ribosomal protein S20 [Planctomycetaceae bacterium]